ncbi:GYD domain-containing protein [Alphaproteobacteria bacterium]|nr:GYD domain-containing protein [Alphaproteobacteria bacterium]
MTKYYLIGKLSMNYIQGMMSNPDQDRKLIVEKMTESVNCKLHGMDFVRGDYDIVATVEGDYESILSCKMAVMQSGMMNEMIILDTNFDIYKASKLASTASGGYKKTSE